jgi:hypothetical protein
MDEIEMRRAVDRAQLPAVLPVTAVEAEHPHDRVGPLLIAPQEATRPARPRQGRALQRARLKRSFAAGRAPLCDPESFQVKPDG